MASKSKNAAGQTALSSATRWRVIIYSLAGLIALLGLADAIYLTVAHLTGDDAVCGSSTGCSVVLGSAYAAIGGIPTAAFGVLAYFVVFSSAVLAGFGYRRAGGFLALVVAIMFLTTLWLLYLQAFVLHAFCPFCLLSAALTFMLSGVLLAAPSFR